MKVPTRRRGNDDVVDHPLLDGFASMKVPTRRRGNREGVHPATRGKYGPQ